MFKFRENTYDEAIWKSVVTKNEYKLRSDLKFNSVLCLGSHIGSFAYKVCSEHFAQKVLCLEPSPDNFKLLVHNLYEVAKLQDKVVVLNAAVDSETHSVILYNDISNPNTGEHSINRVSDGVKVPALAIDSILEMFSGQISLIKMDIEYSEHKVIPVVKDWPKKCKYLIGEWHGGEMQDFKDNILTPTGYENIVIIELVKSIGLFWCWQNCDPSPIIL